MARASAEEVAQTKTLGKLICQSQVDRLDMGYARVLSVSFLYLSLSIVKRKQVFVVMFFGQYFFLLPFSLLEGQVFAEIKRSDREHLSFSMLIELESLKNNEIFEI